MFYFYEFPTWYNIHKIQSDITLNNMKPVHILQIPFLNNMGTTLKPLTSSYNKTNQMH